MANHQVQTTKKHQLINVDPLELRRQTALLFFMLGPFTILYVLENFLAVFNLNYVHYFFVQSAVLVLSHVFNLNLGPAPRVVYQDNYESSTTIEEVEEEEENKEKQDTQKTLTNSEGSSHKYSASINSMFEEFEKIISNNIENSPGKWSIMVNQPDAQLKVFRDSSKDYRYACETYLDNSPASVIDTVLDPGTRDPSSNKLADKYVSNIQLLEQVDPVTNITLLESKGIWPTAGRIACFISSAKVLPDNSVLLVLKSIDVDNKPPPKDSKAVNLDIFLSGLILVPVEGNPKKCKIVAICDVDPHGWIPQSLISLIASQVVPYVLKRLNTKVQSRPVKTVPRLTELTSNQTSSLTVSTSANSPNLTPDNLPPSPTSSTGTLVAEPNPNSKATIPERPKGITHSTNPGFFNQLLNIKSISSFFFNRFALGTGSTILIVGVIMSFMFRRNK